MFFNGQQHRHGGKTDSGHLVRYLGTRLVDQIVELLCDAIKFLCVKAKCKGKELGLVHQMEMDVETEMEGVFTLQHLILSFLHGCTTVITAWCLI